MRVTEKSRQAKILAIRQCAEWLVSPLHHPPPPDSLRTARTRLAKELENRADRLEARLRVDQARQARRTKAAAL